MTGFAAARTSLACAALLALPMLACASAGPKKPEPAFIRLMWPEPPEVPRIQFERWLSSDVHLGREISFGERMTEVLAGKSGTSKFLEQPMDLAVSDDGSRLYVSDFSRGKVYLFDLVAKRVTAIPENGLLANPFGVEVDAASNLYVVEQSSRVIRVFGPDLKELRRFTDPSLVRPADIALDRKQGRLYVADPSRQASTDHSVKIFDLEGKLLGTLGSGRGLCDDCLLFPTFVAVDPAGRVLVSSTIKARIDIFDSQGRHTGHVGERGTAFGMFDRPKGVALDTFGNIYVTDSGWSNVQIFNPRSQVLLFFGGRGDYPGLLKNPTGIAIDHENRIYVADYLNNRVTVYRLVNTQAEDSFLEPPAPVATEPTEQLQTVPLVPVAAPARPERTQSTLSAASTGEEKTQ